MLAERWEVVALLLLQFIAGWGGRGGRAVVAAHQPRCAVAAAVGGASYLPTHTSASIALCIFLFVLIGGCESGGDPHGGSDGVGDHGDCDDGDDDSRDTDGRDDDGRDDVAEVWEGVGWSVE